MVKKDLRSKYLNHYASVMPLETTDRGLSIVIPAYGEDQYLPATLDALEDVDRAEECRVVVIVNHGPEAPAEAKESNDKVWDDLLKRKGKQRFDLQVLDARNKGDFATSSKVGVGLARKIAMDSALAAYSGPEEEGVLVCLDADCLVSQNYIDALLNWTRAKPEQGTVNIPYEHRLPEDPEHRKAIVTYELFLRYYVGGLKAYKNLYGHHSMGSAFATRHRTYCAARGMVKRRAAEDFYFLDKVAKLAPIGTLNEARVYPSPRISERVIFGTGRTMLKARDGDPLSVFYDLRTFALIDQVRSSLKDAREEQLYESGRELGVDWQDYLKGRGWPKARAGLYEGQGAARRARPAFDHWFDGLESLKLAHFIRDEIYRPQAALEVMPGFAKLLGSEPEGQELEDWFFWARKELP